MQFILPKLLGLTVVAGIAVFVLGMIFKILLAGLVLAGVGTLVAKMIGKKQRRMLPYENYREDFIPSKRRYERPVNAGFPQMKTENLAIIPIN